MHIDEHKHFRLADFISIVLSIVTLLTVISAGFFWFYKTSALPQRVDSAEKRLDKIEKQMIENNIKTELIYQAILEVRSVLLKN